MKIISLFKKNLLIFIVLFLLFSPTNVFAANGDYAVYRDSLGTFETNVTSYTGVPFDTQVQQDGIFTQNANDIDVDLSSAGKYLFGYVIQSRNDSYGNRVSWLSRVTLAGTEQLLGHGQAYRRNSSNDRYYAYGYGLVDATAGDDLRVEIIREGTQDPTTHLLEADNSSFWVLKLDNNWDYLRLQAADNQVTTVAKQNINFTTSLENTDANIFGHDTGTNPHQITLKEAGHYLVVYNVGVDGSTDRTTITSNTALDGTPVEQSYDYAYMRYDNGTITSATSNMTIIEAAADDILTLEWGATGAFSPYSTDTVSSKTGISVIRLPDSAEYLRVHETTDGQTINATATTVITFDTQDEADSASFSYNTTSGVTTIQKDGDYLFTSGGRTNRGTSGGTRLTRGGYWYVNDTKQSIGGTGMYVRGDQSTQDTFDGGWSAATIFALSNTNTIDFRYEDGGNDGNSADALQADSYGITAVNIGSLFSSGGLLSVDIVDSGGASVGSPSISMSSVDVDFTDQTSTGTFGVSSEKIRVTNSTATSTWTLSLAASDGSTATWDGTGNSYDYNDPTINAGDGSDTDSEGGRMTIDPSVGTITPQGGCSSTNLTLGSSTGFDEELAVNSITLLSAASGADTNCYWDLTGISVSQTIPPEQPADSYSINLTLTAVSS